MEPAIMEKEDVADRLLDRCHYNKQFVPLFWAHVLDITSGASFRREEGFANWLGDISHLLKSFEIFPVFARILHDTRHYDK